MAAASVPAGRFLPGKGTVARAAGALRRMVMPVRAPLANLASVPLHVAGLGCLDFAAFHLPDPGFWGWAVVAASLVWLEHVIADEP